MRDCARVASSQALGKRVARVVAPVFRAKDPNQVRAMYRLACEMPREVLPQGRPRPRGGRARRPHLPRPPEVALEAPAHDQRAGEDQQGDQAQVEGGAGVPLEGVAGPPGGVGAVRAGRGVVGVALPLGGEDFRAPRGQAEARAADRGAQRGVQARGGAGNQGEPRACGQDGGGIGYRTRVQILATAHSLGRDELSTRPRAYTNFLDATRFTPTLAISKPVASSGSPRDL